MGGHDGEQPQQPQAAHPEDRDEHGGYRLARPPDGSSEQLDENIGDIAGGQEAHHLHSHLQYVGVGGEDGQQGPGQQEKGSAEQDGEARRHSHRHPDTLFQALILPGAVVLPGKGGDGLGHGGNGHPENDIHLAVGGPGGHSVGAKGVDGGLDDDIGGVVHHRLEGGGHTDHQDAAHGHGIDAQPLGKELIGGHLGAHE